MNTIDGSSKMNAKTNPIETTLLALFTGITTVNIINTWRHVGIEVNNQKDEVIAMCDNGDVNEEDDDGTLNDIDIGFASLGIEEDNEEEAIMNQHYKDNNDKE
jgi:hypothetical protein